MQFDISGSERNVKECAKEGMRELGLRLRTMTVIARFPVREGANQTPNPSHDMYGLWDDWKIRYTRVCGDSIYYHIKYVRFKLVQMATQGSLFVGTSPFTIWFSKTTLLSPSTAISQSASIDPAPLYPSPDACACSGIRHEDPLETYPPNAENKLHNVRCRSHMRVLR